jgi:hypothetical protein
MPSRGSAPQQFGQPERSQRQLMRPPICGVSLHCYRYAWVERALKYGFPERFAQEAFGHNSKAVHGRPPGLCEKGADENSKLGGI